MKKLVILSTDTLHHRYFINKILGQNIVINTCLFETQHVEPKFKVGPLFEEEELLFEKKHFFKEVKQELKFNNIVSVDTVNSSECLNKLNEIQPDFGIVFGTGIIKKHIIQLFKDGLLNVHRGISQEYRGLDSDLWAIYHSDYQNLGVTIHKVEETLDTGEIIFEKKMTIVQNIKIHQIRYYTTLLATEMVIEAINNYLAGRLISHKQGKKGRYYSFMPLALKKIVADKFHRFSEHIDG